MFLMPDNKWARLLAYVTGLVNQKLLLQNEYLAIENRIPRAHLPTRIRLSRDTKFCAAFLDVLRSSGVRPLALPPRSPNLNAFSERWVGSIRQECLSKLILFGEASLRRALNEYIEHHHFERNHQGKGNLLLFPSPDVPLSPKNRTPSLSQPTRWLA